MHSIEFRIYIQTFHYAWAKHNSLHGNRVDSHLFIGFSWKWEAKSLRASWHRGTSLWPTCSSILLVTRLLHQSGNSFISSICSRSSSWTGCITMRAEAGQSWISVTVGSSKHRWGFYQGQIDHFLRTYHYSSIIPLITVSCRSSWSWWFETMSSWRVKWESCSTALLLPHRP